MTKAERKAALTEAIAKVEVSVEELAAVREAVQEDYDALSEKAQEDEEKGGKLAEFMEAIEEAENLINDVLSQLKELEA